MNIITNKIISIDNPELVRAIAPHSVPLELFKAEVDGHKFKAGDICVLHGLVDYPEYNGNQVEISSIRKNGPKGKAYYLKGDITKLINWVYEYRLKSLAE